jgi:hypothetical protein
MSEPSFQAKVSVNIHKLYSIAPVNNDDMPWEVGEDMGDPCNLMLLSTHFILLPQIYVATIQFKLH